MQEFIKEVLKGQVQAISSSMSTYVKPYMQRIELLRMLTNYKPPKFQQFDKKGNPREHVAHFIETCNNARIEGDLLVK